MPFSIKIAEDHSVVLAFPLYLGLPKRLGLELRRQKKGAEGHSLLLRCGYGMARRPRKWDFGGSCLDASSDTVAV